MAPCRWNLLEIHPLEVTIIWPSRMLEVSQRRHSAEKLPERGSPGKLLAAGHWVGCSALQLKPGTEEALQWGSWSLEKPKSVEAIWTAGGALLCKLIDAWKQYLFLLLYLYSAL